MLKIKQNILSMFRMHKVSIPDHGDIPKIVSDRKCFDDLLYTPLDQAWTILEERRKDKELEKNVLNLLNGDLPIHFNEGAKAVLFRNLISPNYEVRRFVSIVDGFSFLKPLFFEHIEDKFTSNNQLKRSLGKMYFVRSIGKKGGTIMQSENIIDFVESDGKLISEVKTKWGEGLVDFHHRYFAEKFRPMPDTFYSGSKWLKSKGANAQEYYKSFFLLFIRHGILFENMMLDSKEKVFAEKVFLPAFISVYKALGVKPLIFALEPTDIEGDHFWTCYPASDKEYVTDRML